MFIFGLLILSCCANSHELRNNVTISGDDIRDNSVNSLINQSDEYKLKRDSLLVDSMVSMMWENFKCINESRIQIIKDYILSCSNEEASEGIADSFGKAFVEDDVFLKQMISLYDVLEDEDRNKLKKWIVGCLYFYIDSWATQNNLSLNPSHEYEDWILSYQDSDMVQIIELGNNLRQNKFDLIHRFCY